ncbi:MAG: transposase [Desulfobacterales bacterium]|nr:transposase [Desulfobacterales bacterium]
MARLLRISPKNVPIHIIQRGNNRQVCFGSDDNHVAYAGWLKEYSKKYNVDVHAWVMMTNHVHLLCTPRQENGISSMMQALGRLYVRYFNSEYKRSGTLWEGRYKSCLVESGTYLLKVYRYIELNPVRAKMVSSPGDYCWSSYQINALGKASDLCTPHPEYMMLGADSKERCNKYRTLFEQDIYDQDIKLIRSATNKGMVVGNDRFLKEIEVLTGRRVKEKKRGRPVGWRKPEV